MTQAIVAKETAPPANFTSDHVELIKNTVCKGSTDQELDLFLYTANQIGLNPLMGQIHAVKRFDKSVGREVMSIQIGVDGYRLIAERTGKYAPGRDTAFSYDKNGRLISARAFVKKLTQDGTWHEVSAIAFYGECVQTNREGRPTMLWHSKPHVMLEKCAEVAALRKAFPHETVVASAAEEVPTLPVEEALDSQENSSDTPITKQQLKEILEQIGAEPETLDKLLKWAGIQRLDELPSSKYSAALKCVEMRKAKG